MREKAALTDAEMKIMLHLWDHHPQTMMELTRALESETHWSKYTVITLLKRMEAKGTVTVDESGPVKTYAPAVEKAAPTEAPPWDDTPPPADALEELMQKGKTLETFKIT